jgi:hypothetical protein
MTTELSTPIKIAALVALLVAAGAAATMLLLRGHPTSQPQTIATTPTHVRTPAHSHPAATHHAAPVAPRFATGLPTALVAPLTRSKVIVAVIYLKGDPVAADLLAQARAGARLARAKLVILNVASDKVASQTASWMSSNVVDPSVLVVKRPGTIAVELDGYADKMAVAQAVVNSRG